MNLRVQVLDTYSSFAFLQLDKNVGQQLVGARSLHIHKPRPE